MRHPRVRWRRVEPCIDEALNITGAVAYDAITEAEDIHSRFLYSLLFFYEFAW
jgi:hypothetical protein